jgi:hypothetical protein
MMQFIPGKKLSELYFSEVIHPLLSEHFPSLIYSAAQLGWGSDVLDMDTPMSMDHGWGPRLTLFLNGPDFVKYEDTLDQFFVNHLPFTFKGFSTHFEKADSGSFVMEARNEYPIRHMITVTTPERFFADTLGVELQKPLTPPIWLTIPQQRLLTVQSGEIYYDGLGSLEPLRSRFHWYPDDLWCYLLANQWQRIDQDAPFLSRTGYVADELGSRLLGARLISDLMNLVFLMEKQFAPYRKWIGSVFQRLDLAPYLTPIFNAILDSQDWVTRESYLTEAYLLVIKAHNALNLTEEIPVRVQAFHDRPFLVPPAGEIANALLDGVTDPAVKALPAALGSVNQISDSTDVLDDIPTCKKLRVLYP